MILYPIVSIVKRYKMARWKICIMILNHEWTRMNTNISYLCKSVRIRGKNNELATDLHG